MRQRNGMIGLLLLFSTALIWGGSFVAQKLGMNHIGPFAFTFFSDLLAGVFLFALVVLRVLAKGGRFSWSRTDVVGGIVSGIALWCGMMLQQIGIQSVSPGVCAFLTANYVLVVPLLGLFTARRPGASVWPCVALSLAGSWLLCNPAADAAGSSALGLSAGEILSALCAIAFGVQICAVERFMSRPDADALRLTCVSFATGAVLCVPFLALSLERELLTPGNIASATGAVAFCGFLSSGLACTLQNAGQRLVSPPVAALVLAQESVFATVFGVLFMGDVLSVHQIAGCALVFAAVVMTQLFQFIPRKMVPPADGGDKNQKDKS
jgi:drug/metabolite transporter (DMT)-like permease